MQIDKISTNFVPACPKPYTPSHKQYTWQKLRSWTGSPQFVQYFDKKDDKDAMLSFSMAHENPETLETAWFSVAVFDNNAEKLKQYLLDNQETAFLFVEGTLKLSPEGYKNIAAKKVTLYEFSRPQYRAEPTDEVLAAHAANRNEDEINEAIGITAPPPELDDTPF